MAIYLQEKYPLRKYYGLIALSCVCPRSTPLQGYTVPYATKRKTLIDTYRYPVGTPGIVRISLQNAILGIDNFSQFPPSQERKTRLPRDLEIL